jgi:predicted DNA-binding WGR domain protein
MVEVAFRCVEEGMERALARFGYQETVDVKTFCEEIRKESEILRREFEHKTKGYEIDTREQPV